MGRFFFQKQRTGTLKDISLAEAGRYGTLNEFAFFDKVSAWSSSHLCVDDDFVTSEKRILENIKGYHLGKELIDLIHVGGGLKQNLDDLLNLLMFDVGLEPI